jgi:hypothetical protein
VSLEIIRIVKSLPKFDLLEARNSHGERQGTIDADRVGNTLN